jgi:hypothetical protein
MGSGGGKSGNQTIGYRYYFSLLMGIGRGPVDEIVEIEVGDEKAWQGPVRRIDGDSMILINKPNLFGGDEKEGGVQGPCRVLWGESDQELGGAVPTSLGTSPSIPALIGGLVPAMRGVITMWFDGLVTAMNPYPKEWKIRVRRWRSGWHNDDPWYPDKAMISMANGAIKAMNAAHIIYESSTNPEWGNGAPVELIDENSFIYAANQLYAEGFGLCIAWMREEDIDVFIKTILDHVGGVLYTDRETGLLTFRLIRSDYVVNDLPLFTPDTGLLDILSDDTGASDVTYNEIVVKFHDPITNEDGEARAQNVGAIVAQGAVSSRTMSLPGLPTKELAGRVALRELKTEASGLKKFKVRLDRSAWRIAPGMPFRVRDLKRGIEMIVLRAGEISDGTFKDGSITVSAMEDVFGMPATALTTPETSGWTSPPTEAVPPLASRLVEMSYYDFFRSMSAADLAQITTTDARVGELAVAPNSTSVQYDLWTKADGETDYAFRRSASFSASATIASTITALQTTFTIANPRNFPSSIVGQVLLIDEERLAVVDFDDVTNLLTVKRGVGDTIPRPHADGARVWFPDDDLSSDYRLYTEGETVFAKALTRISTDLLALEDADEDSVVLSGRFPRPYPVADLKVDGVSIYDTSIRSDLLFTWESRNRVIQQDQLVGHTEGGVAAEDGTSYRIKIWNHDGSSLIREESGVTNTSWVYSTEKIFQDALGEFFIFDIYSERDGFFSVEHYHLPVRRNVSPQSFGVFALSGSSTALAEAGGVSSDLLDLSGSATGTVS